MRTYDVHLDLDTRCNYRCVYCPNFDAADSAAPKGPISIVGFGRAMACLSKFCWHVYLSCAGEPLLHPDLCDILASVGKRLRHTDTTLVTNGYLLDRPRRELVLSCGLSRLLVSVDTVDQEQYRRFCRTGPEALERVMSNVESLIKERGGRRWPKVTVTAVAMRSTLNGLPAVARWAAAAGVDAMRVQWLEPYENATMKTEAVRAGPETAPVLRQVGLVLRRSGLYFDCPRDSGIAKVRSVLEGAALMRNPLEYLVFSLRIFLRSRRPVPCWRPGLSLTMLSDYSLYLCPRALAAVGNAAENPAPLLAARLKAATAALRRTPPPECRDCRYRVS